MSGGTLIVRIAVITFGLLILAGALLVSSGESSEPAVSSMLPLLP